MEKKSPYYDKIGSCLRTFREYRQYDYFLDSWKHVKYIIQELEDILNYWNLSKSLEYVVYDTLRHIQETIKNPLDPLVIDYIQKHIKTIHMYGHTIASKRMIKWHFDKTCKHLWLSNWNPSIAIHEGYSQHVAKQLFTPKQEWTIYIIWSHPHRIKSGKFTKEREAFHDREQTIDIYEKTNCLVTFSHKKGKPNSLSWFTKSSIDSALVDMTTLLEGYLGIDVTWKLPLE